MKRIYRWILITVLTLVVLYLTYIRVRYNDCIEEGSFTIGYQDLENVSAEELAKEEYILYTEGFQHIYFYSGTYEFEISARSKAQDAYFQVVDLWTNTVLFQSAYTYTEDVTLYEFQITTTGNYENVVIQSYVSSEDLKAILENDKDPSSLLEIYYYYIKSDGAVCTDGKWTVFLFAVVLLLVAFGIYRMIYQRKSAFFSVMVLAIITSLPFLNDYLPSGHDWKFHLSRIFSLGQSLMQGQIPQRLNVSMASADITPLLYPELVLYVGGFLCAAGTTAWFAYQVTFILITFLTAFVAYYAARQVSDQQTALIFTFVYLANPFRLNEIFVRTAVGEAFGMAFLPLIVAGMWKILCCENGSDHKQGFADLVLGYTGLISAHIILSVVSAYICILIVVIVFLARPVQFFKNVRRLAWIILAAILVVFLNFWFLVPFLQFFGLETNISAEATFARMQYTAPYLWQVFMGVTAETSDAANSKAATGEMSLTIGFALLIGMVTFIWMMMRDCTLRRAKSQGNYPASANMNHKEAQTEFLTPKEVQIGGLSFLVAMIFLYMSSSYFPWEWFCETFSVVGITLGRMQHAWRLLSVVALMLSIVLVVVLRVLLRRKTICTAVLSGMIFVICLISAIDAGVHYFSDGTAMEDKFTVESEIYPDYLLAWADSDEVKSWYLSGEGPKYLSEDNEEDAVDILSYHRDGTDYSFTYTNFSSNDIIITAPILYYGLHTAYLKDEKTGTEVVLDSSANETTQFTDVLIPANSEGRVEIRYSKPILWSMAELVSILTIMAVAGIFIFDRGHRRLRRM